MTTFTVNNRKMFLKKIYDILIILNSLYSLQTQQYISTYFDSIENILTLFYHSFYIN